VLPQAKVRKHALGLWPKPNASPVCDDSDAQAAYAAIVVLSAT